MLAFVSVYKTRLSTEVGRALYGYTGCISLAVYTRYAEHSTPPPLFESAFNLGSDTGR